MTNCKYIDKRGICRLKGCYSTNHKCFGEDMCKCREPMTNADRIRAMSDEELTVFIDGLTANCVDCESEDVHNVCPIHSIGLGRYCGPRDIMKWLHMPAEGGTV